MFFVLVLCFVNVSKSRGKLKCPPPNFVKNYNLENSGKTNVPRSRGKLKCSLPDFAENRRELSKGNCQ